MQSNAPLKDNKSVKPLGSPFLRHSGTLALITALQNFIKRTCMTADHFDLV